MTSPKRVIEVFDSLEISGGVQAVVMNVIRNADHQRVTIDVAVYQNPESNSYAAEVIENGGNVYSVRNLSSCGPTSFYRQFYTLFKKGGYDAVHAHNLHHNGLILLAAKRAGVPMRISHAHQSYDDRNASFSRRSVAKGLCKINNKVATRRVACSDLAGRFLYGKKSFEFLPNAVDFNRFSIEESKEELRLRYGIPLDANVLLHIGRFSLEKNQLFLVDVMKKLDDGNCKLFMVGDGSLFDEFVRNVNDAALQSKIECLGIRSDVPELLKLADWLLLPSLNEGLPVVVVEAQAVGCPSIVSDLVTKQVDLGLGLVEFATIETPEIWADRVRMGSLQRHFNPEEVKAKMVAMKYEITANLDAWYELYGCGE